MQTAQHHTSLIPRPNLMNALLTHIGTPDIKVLIGVRRCGKSSLLRMLNEHFTNQGIPSQNILFKRLDSFDIPLGYQLSDLDQDVRTAAENALPGYPFCVLLDEVQTIEGWEQVVRRLHTLENADVYITGSNAQLLSSDLATYLTGRYMEIPVYPLSFSEYIDFSGGDRASVIDIQRLFDGYLTYGGMPGLFALNELDEERAAAELQAIYQSIVFKDVAQRYRIRDLPTLEKLSRYLFATSGNLLSINRIVNTLKSSGVPTSVSAIENQIGALEKAYVIYRAEQTSTQGRKLLRPQSKYYPVDNGFRNLATGFSGRDLGAQLEGIVFMELVRRGWRVKVGAGLDEEIDFVASKRSKKVSIQVTLGMLDETTRTRELKPLQTLTDAFPRLVITMDRLGTGTTEEGIQIVNAIDWLLDPTW